jgi:predicted DNA-binding transcriptional regulator AlpA
MQDDTIGGEVHRQTPHGATLPEAIPAQSPSEPPALLTERTFRAALGGMSERKFRALLAAGTIPAPLMLGPRVSRWTAADFAATVARLPRREKAPEPQTLAEGRRAKIARLKGAS